MAASADSNSNPCTGTSPTTGSEAMPVSVTRTGIVTLSLVFKPAFIVTSSTSPRSIVSFEYEPVANRDRSSVFGFSIVGACSHCGNLSA